MEDIFCFPIELLVLICLHLRTDDVISFCITCKAAQRLIEHLPLKKKVILTRTIENPQWFYTSVIATGPEMSGFLKEGKKRLFPERCERVEITNFIGNIHKQLYYLTNLKFLTIDHAKIRRNSGRWLPKSVTHLTLIDCQHPPIPEGIISLHIRMKENGWGSNVYHSYTFPESLESLHLSTDYDAPDYLPLYSFEKNTFGSRIRTIRVDHQFILDVIPPSVTKIVYKDYGLTIDPSENFHCEKRGLYIVATREL